MKAELKLIEQYDFQTNEIMQYIIIDFENGEQKHLSFMKRDLTAETIAHGLINLGQSVLHAKR